MMQRKTMAETQVARLGTCDALAKFVHNACQTWGWNESHRLRFPLLALSVSRRCSGLTCG